MSSEASRPPSAQWGQAFSAAPRRRTCPSRSPRVGGSRKEKSPPGDLGRPSARFRSGGRSPARQAPFGARPPSSGDEQANRRAQQDCSPSRVSLRQRRQAMKAGQDTSLSEARCCVLPRVRGAASKRGGARRKACRAWVNRPEGRRPATLQEERATPSSKAARPGMPPRFLADIVRVMPPLTLRRREMVRSMSARPRQPPFAICTQFANTTAVVPGELLRWRCLSRPRQEGNALSDCRQFEHELSVNVPLLKRWRVGSRWLTWRPVRCVPHASLVSARAQRLRRADGLGFGGCLGFWAIRNP